MIKSNWIKQERIFATYKPSKFRLICARIKFKVSWGYLENYLPF